MLGNTPQGTIHLWFQQQEESPDRFSLHLVSMIQGFEITKKWGRKCCTDHIWLSFPSADGTGATEGGGSKLEGHCPAGHLCFSQVLIYEQPENLGHLSSGNFLPKQMTRQTQCLPHSDQSMCLLWLICSPAGSLLLCAGLASIEHTSKPSLKILRKLFPCILPPFLTSLFPDNTESGKHSTYKSRLWSSIPGML